MSLPEQFNHLILVLIDVFSNLFKLMRLHEFGRITALAGGLEGHYYRSWRRLLCFRLMLESTVNEVFVEEISPIVVALSYLTEGLVLQRGEMGL
jgi:hypothetical protein